MLHHKLWPIALACAVPCLSAQAQSPADLQQEIAALRAQIKALSDKVEALSTSTTNTQTAPGDSTHQVTQLEQKLNLAQEDAIKSGFKGLKIKGVLEAMYLRDSSAGVNTFSAAGDGGYATGMLDLSKEVDGGGGVNWTLRLMPGSSHLVNEATVSFPISESTRVYGGLIPDFQGYESGFAHLNPLLTHNALFDLAGPTNYTGIGMGYAISKDLALKWMIGNIDGAADDAGAYPNAPTPPLPPAPVPRTAGLAYRLDWTVNDYASLGLSGAHATSARQFNAVALDGGYIRGNWLINGQLNVGNLTAGAYNGSDARWWGLSALAGYKVTPRLQLLARADYLNNQDNGGGIYVGHYFNNLQDISKLSPLAGTGLGPKLNDVGGIIDPVVGADLTRVSLGTNYSINPSTQWKTELRVDQSTGFNFVDENGSFTQHKTTVGTSVVVSF